MAKVKKKVIKVKKKHWFKVIAPKAFDETVLGECYVAESSLMKGKPLSLNLKCFAYRMSKQNISVSFIVDEVKESRAYCSLTKYKLLQASVKRLASRGKEKILDSFVVKSKDDKNVRIKFILITNGKVSNSILTVLRNKLRENTANILAGVNYEDILLQTISYKIQPQLKKILAKTYPLRVCAIKELYVEKRKNSLKNIIIAKKPVNREEEQVIHNKKEEPKKEKVVIDTEKKEIEIKLESESKEGKTKSKKIEKEEPKEKSELKQVKKPAKKITKKTKETKVSKITKKKIE